MIYVPISVPSFLILRIHDTYFWIYQDRDHDGVALGEGGQGSCPPLPLEPWSSGAELSSPSNSYSCLGASVTLLCTGGWWPESRVLLQPRAHIVLTRAWPVSPCPGGAQPRSLNPFFPPFPLPPFCSLSNYLSCPVSLPFACPCVLVPTHKGSSSVKAVPERPGLPPPPQPHLLAHSLTHSPAFYPKL